MEEDKPTASQQLAVPDEGIEVLKALRDRLEHPTTIESAYANNVRFESSVWDLKLIFGQLNQQRGQGDVDWHTAITLPWMQTKILEYYLRANIAYYERNNAPIKVPAFLIPALPDPPTEDQIKSDPRIVDLLETYKKIHAEIFGA